MTTDNLQDLLNDINAFNIPTINDELLRRIGSTAKYAMVTWDTQADLEIVAFTDHQAALDAYADYKASVEEDGVELYPINIGGVRGWHWSEAGEQGGTILMTL